MEHLDGRASESFVVLLVSVRNSKLSYGMGRILSLNLSKELCTLSRIRVAELHYRLLYSYIQYVH